MGTRRKPSYKHMGQRDRKAKLRLLKIMLTRRFDRNAEFNYLMKYIHVEKIDDMLLETMVWDATTRNQL